MNQPDLFPVGFSVGPKGRAFNPRPVPADHRRVIFRCTRKGCKFCKTYDLPTVERESLYMGRSQGTFRALDSTARARAYSLTTCPEHGQNSIQGEEVQGTVNHGRQCDPRCTMAIGPDCSCACGGANHGCAWL